MGLKGRNREEEEEVRDDDMKEVDGRGRSDVEMMTGRDRDYVNEKYEE